MMDNPKKANQGKYNRSKRKKEHFSKGSKSSSSTDGDKYQKGSNEKEKPNQSNFKGPHTSAATQQSSSVADKTVNKTSESDSIAQQKIVFANLKKETEEIENLTQKYGRRHLISTWTRDFDIPCSRDRDDEEEGADFNDLISGYSTDFVGRHFMLKEEQEWMKQSDSSESPFSLDLKCLETGISCIPFYKRHDLSEKSFNPKEIQSMISEAQSNEIVYKNKETLNEKTQNRNVLISKDPAYDSILSILKQEDNSSSTNNIRKANASEFVNTSVDKFENVEDRDNVSNKTSSNERDKNEFVDNFSHNTNNSSVSTFDYDNSKSGEALEAKGQRQSRSRRSNVTVTYSQNYTTENSKVMVDSNFKEVKQEVNDAENKDSSNDTENKDSSSPDFVIQSLEPRSQRRPRRELKQDKVFVDNKEEKIDEIDKPSFSSFIGLNSCVKIKNDEFSIDGETNQPDLSIIKSSVTSTQVESNDVCNEINFVSSVKLENKYKDDDEKVELNLSSLKKLKVCVKPDHVQNKEFESKIGSTVNSNSEVTYSYDDQKKIEKKSVKANDKLSLDYDDDLDFLLGLEKPFANLESTSVSQVNDNSLSNLSILQEKLKGTATTKTDKKFESNNVKKPERFNNINRNEHNRSNNQPDEDLDEWLDSVLEK